MNSLDCHYSGLPSPKAYDMEQQQQTSIEWLFNKIYQDPYNDMSDKEWFELLEQAKAMYDEEMLAKYGEGYDEGLYDGMCK